MAIEIDPSTVQPLAPPPVPPQFTGAPIGYTTPALGFSGTEQPAPSPQAVAASQAAAARGEAGVTQPLPSIDIDPSTIQQLQPVGDSALVRGAKAAGQREWGYLKGEAKGLITPTLGIGQDQPVWNEQTGRYEVNFVDPLQGAGKVWDALIHHGPVAAAGAALFNNFDQFPEWMQNLMTGKKVPESIGQGAVDAWQQLRVLRGVGPATATSPADMTPYANAAVRGAAQAVNVARENAPVTGATVGANVGGYVGAKVGGALGMPGIGATFGGGTGGTVGYGVGKLLQKLPRIPGETFGFTIPESDAAIPPSLYTDIVNSYEGPGRLTDRQVRGLGQAILQTQREQQAAGMAAARTRQAAARAAVQAQQAAAAPAPAAPEGPRPAPEEPGAPPPKEPPGAPPPEEPPGAPPPEEPPGAPPAEAPPPAAKTMKEQAIDLANQAADEGRNVSISELQRKLRIGYDAAENLHNNLKAEGYISPLREDVGQAGTAAADAADVAKRQREFEGLQRTAPTPPAAAQPTPEAPTAPPATAPAPTAAPAREPLKRGEFPNHDEIARAMPGFNFQSAVEAKDPATGIGEAKFNEYKDAVYSSLTRARAKFEDVPVKSDLTELQNRGVDTSNIKTYKQAEDALAKSALTDKLRQSVEQAAPAVEEPATTTADYISQLVHTPDWMRKLDDHIDAVIAPGKELNGLVKARVKQYAGSGNYQAAADTINDARPEAEKAARPTRKTPVAVQ